MNGSIIFSETTEGIPDFKLFLAQGLEQLLFSLTVDDYVTPNSIYAFQSIDQRFYVLGISLVQQSTILDDRKITPQRRPALVYIDEITDSDLYKLNDKLFIKDLQLIIRAAKINHH